MIARIKLLWKFYLVCYDINERYDIRQTSFSSIFDAFCITSNLGVSGFSYRIFLIFESSQLNEFQPICKILALKLFHNLRNRVIFPRFCSFYRYFLIPKLILLRNVSNRRIYLFSRPVDWCLFVPCFPAFLGQERLITLLLNSGPTLGPRRVVPYSPIKSLEFSF